MNTITTTPCDGRSGPCAPANPPQGPEFQGPMQLRARRHVYGSLWYGRDLDLSRVDEDNPVVVMRYLRGGEV